MRIQKVKLTLFVFAILLISSLAFYSLAQNQAQSSDNIFLDSDQDGLSNAEEKIYGTDPNNADTDEDGYTDGAEVKAGYDPLKASPGDKFATTDNNAQTTAIIPTADNNTAVLGDSTAQEDSTNLSSNSNDTNSQTVSQNDDATAPNNQGTQSSTNGQTNLTQELADKVSDLINEKSANNEEISISDLDSLISEATASQLTFDDLPEIDESNVKILKQNYSSLSDDEKQAKEKDDDLKYLTAVAYILVNNAPQKITQPEDLNVLSNDILNQVSNLTLANSDMTYFEDLADHGQNSLTDLKEVEVPENMLETHIKALQLANYALTLKDSAKMISDDPAASMVNLSKVENLITLTQTFVQETENKFGDLGISEIPLSL